MKLPTHLTTVTPLSKFLALFVFILFPLVGFKLGMEYQRLMNQSQDYQIENQVFPSQEECQRITGKVCVDQMCDYIPQGKTFEEVCGKDFKKGWVATKQPLDETPTLVTSDEVEAFCDQNGGRFLYELNETNKYMECENIDEQTCIHAGGTFDECASACRHDPNAQYCTENCVPVCKF